MKFNKLLALVAGILFPLAFAPIHWLGCIFISCAMLFLILENSPSARDAAWCGFWFGIGKYGVGVSWVYLSMAHFTGFPFVFVLLLTLLLVSLFSLYEALAGWCFSWLKIRHQHASPIISCLNFAATMTLVEVTRSSLFTGFPWLLAGVSLVESPLRHLAPLIGSMGLSFMLYTLATFLAQALFINVNDPLKPYRYGCGFVLPFLLVPLLLPSDWSHPIIKQPIEIRLLQGNVDQNDKWQETSLTKILALYTNMTRENIQNHLVIWPETAFPIPSQYATHILEELQQFAQKHHGSVIIGLPGSNKDNSYSNSALMLSKDQQRYDKQHLVPFGEYMPFKFLYPFYQQFNIPLSDLTPGQSNDTYFDYKGHKLIPFICFEIAFIDAVQRARIAKGGALLTLTDDSWFGHSLALPQHIQIAQMRSLESGRQQAFVSNHGLSALIDSHGKIIKYLPYDEVATLKAQLQSYEGIPPFLLWGEWPVYLLTISIMLYLCLRKFTSK